MDRRVTPPKRVTSPTWGPPSPCKQALILVLFLMFSLPSPPSLLKHPSISADPVTFSSLCDEHYWLTSGYIDTRETGSVFNAKPND